MGLLGIYFLVSLGVFLYQITHSPGGWLSYGLELEAISCILTGLVLSGLYSKATTPKGIKIFGLSLIILVIVGLCNFTNISYKPYGNIANEYPIVSKYIQEVKDPILADSVTLLMVNRRPLVWEPVTLYQVGLAYRTWDQTPILLDLENQRFSLVIMEFEVERDWTNSSTTERARTSPEVATAILDNYYLLDTVGMYRIYSPRIDK
jgi:hypothetical protein